MLKVTIKNWYLHEKYVNFRYELNISCWNFVDVKLDWSNQIRDKEENFLGMIFFFSEKRKTEIAWE